MRALPVTLLLAACVPPDLRAPTVPAGDPSEPGPYPVGVSTVVLPEVEGYADVGVEVWYPAAEAGAEATTYDLLGLPVAAEAYRDVAPDPTAPLFLVAFSHGLGGVRQQNYTMADRLASYGFVVVSADHPGTTAREFALGLGDLKVPLLRRPGTVIAAVDAVLGGAVAGLAPRDDGYAMTGHSLGAFTALFVAGAEIDPDAYTAACTGSSPSFVCGLVGPIDATEAELASVADPDPRVVTTVLQAPAGAFAVVEGSGAAVPRPFVQGGAMDDPASTSEPTFALLAEGAAMALYEGGGHNAPTNICDLPFVGVLSPDCGGPEDGYAEPDAVRELTIRHTVAWLGAELGGEPAFEAHLGPGEGYDWRTK